MADLFEDKSGDGEGAITPAGAFSKLRGYVDTQRKGLRPISEFFAKPVLPKATKEATTRLWHNAHHFQANYLLGSLVLAVYCVLSNPMLLFAMVVMFGGAMLAQRTGEDGLSVFGKKLSSKEIMIGTGVIGIPMLVLAGIGSTFFWLLGASACLFGAHAVTRPIDSTPAAEELV